MYHAPVRIGVVSEIPTPYRLPLYRRLAERPELELEVLFCARAEPDRPWALEDALRDVPHVFLPGLAPTIRTRRNTFVYEINPSIVRALRRGRYDLLVVGGYAVFAEQAAILLALARGTPFLLHVESHLLKERSLAVRAAKRLVVSSIVRRASAGLAAGSLAARYLAAYGLPPGRIRIFPNTIDVAEYGRLARAARANAAEVRERHGLPERYALYVGRLDENKGVADLAAALRLLGGDAPALVVAGEGPLQDELAAEAAVSVLGFQQHDRLVELYALADRTVVPSHAETWSVVVNEALACGCPVVVSDAVGAGYDLVEDGRNGYVFPAGDVRALADRLAAPRPQADAAVGRIARWTYDFAVEQFLEALALARG